MTDPTDPAMMAGALSATGNLAVIYADGTGHIRFWNAGAEALFGHSAADVSGKRVDLVIPAAYHDMHWAGFNRTMGTHWRGHDAWSPIVGWHRTDIEVELEVLLTPTTGPDGTVSGVFAMFRRPLTS